MLPWNFKFGNAFTLTYWFSCILRPLTLSTQAWVSKSMASTLMVSKVRTLLLLVLPVADSVCTFLQAWIHVPVQSMVETAIHSHVLSAWNIKRWWWWLALYLFCLLNIRKEQVLNPRICGNYRGIKLMSHTMEIWRRSQTRLQKRLPTERNSSDSCQGGARRMQCLCSNWQWRRTERSKKGCTWCLLT